MGDNGFRHETSLAPRISAIFLRRHARRRSRTGTGSGRRSSFHANAGPHSLQCAQRNSEIRMESGQRRADSGRRGCQGSQCRLARLIPWPRIRLRRFGTRHVNGKPTGEVASFRLANGELEPLSARNSAGIGTCHVAVDNTGRMLISADYMGGSAASFRIDQGRLSEPVWTSAIPTTDPIPIARPPRMLTLRLSHLTTASPTSTTSAATVSTSTSQTPPPRP